MDDRNLPESVRQAYREFAVAALRLAFHCRDAGIASVSTVVMSVDGRVVAHGPILSNEDAKSLPLKVG